MATGALDRTYAAPTTLFFEDLSVGQRASLMRTVMDSDLHLFAEVSGDTNPIHISDQFAARSKFGQRIAHGMFTASLVSAVIGTKLPGPGAIYLSQTIQFLGPVRIGDVVAANVEVVELVPARRRARLFCECICDGKPVLEGEAWVAVESRTPRA
ncbi:MAG TPA: MaoC family dehydratase [Microvirga sp.]|jgi:3-hydroxybutyryl-CoA dehydratase|nr:MaoC family dehydratase [Microvirga sp.]